MGLRFQKRISTPFGRINVSKSGVSLTSVPGMRATLGRTPRVTLGLPGSGLSWTQTLSRRRCRNAAPASGSVQNTPGFRLLLWIGGLILVMAILGAGL